MKGVIGVVPWGIGYRSEKFGLVSLDDSYVGLRSTEELDELIKHRNVINYVKAQRLSWFRHTNRMPETSIVKRIHKWKPFTGRPAGRSKSRWDDGVRNDLKKTKLVKWAEQVQDRSKWKVIVEKTKNLSEL